MMEKSLQSSGLETLPIQACEVTRHQKKKTVDLQGISILVVDHDPSTIRNLKRTLQGFGAELHLAGDLWSAKRIIAHEQIHIIVAELYLKDGSAMDLFPLYKSLNPEGLFYLTSTKTSLDLAQHAIKLGVNHVLEKPIEGEKLAQMAFHLLQARFTSLATTDPLNRILKPYLLFRSAVMKQGLSVLPQIAKSDHSVLITGESGTGKELVSRAIHGLSSFANGPFIALNCGAIPETLIEGELFGHEKGAFTGAIANRKGKFEQAQNGTLFLDEIGEMPLALQVRLLRALEEKVIQRVGSEKDIQLNVRIVAATRANLEEMVHNRLFREDLYYRLNVLRIHLPTLKERKDDIPLLARHFLERAFSETDRKKPYPIFTPESLNLLMEQLWKGNVRELRNLITRIAILLPIEIYQILPTHLVPHFPQQDYFTSSYYNEAEDSQPRQRTTSTPFRQIPAQTEFLSSYQEKTKEQEGVFIPLGMSLKKAEEKIIDLSLEVYQGNRTKVAKVLGIGLRTLRRRLNEQK